MTSSLGLLKLTDADTHTRSLRSALLVSTFSLSAHHDLHRAPIDSPA